jgi:hypothetical protein
MKAAPAMAGRATTGRHHLHEGHVTAGCHHRQEACARTAGRHQCHEAHIHDAAAGAQSTVMYNRAGLKLMSTPIENKQ